MRALGSCWSKAGRSPPTDFGPRKLGPKGTLRGNLRGEVADSTAEGRRFYEIFRILKTPKRRGEEPFRANRGGEKRTRASAGQEKMRPRSARGRIKRGTRRPAGRLPAPRPPNATGKKVNRAIRLRETSLAPDRRGEWLMD